MNDDTGTGTAAPTRAQVHASVTFDRLMAMLESGNEGGCCITCGADARSSAPEAADSACLDRLGLRRQDPPAAPRN